ncbi:hypothetical protein [Paeniglutamicibacter sp. NPDC091659]|uniref:hypothetical protein n=1 Tax=Paeniglutamicibacter sp. NPDC091659 TaxID=3364389 RepID=UPI0038279A6D
MTTAEMWRRTHRPARRCDERMKPASSRNPEIIRMFPDYADTVLWADGPVDYVDTGLSGGLVEDLLAWEQSFYCGLNSNHAFRSRGVELKFIQEGVRLAKLVSSEIGSGHSVEYLGALSLDLPVLFRCPVLRPIRRRPSASTACLKPSCARPAKCGKS